MRTRWLAAATGAALLAGCSLNGPDVTDAWVRLPAVAGRPAAAYATITGGHHDDVLTAIASPAARRVELHHSMPSAHGMMAMRPIARLAIPKGDTIALSPGGIHAMLFDVDPRLEPGGSVRLVFTFDGIDHPVDARLVGAGDPAPE